MDTLAGTRALVRLILRRDRILMPLWVVLLAVPLLIQPSATAELFPTPAQLEAYAQLLRTPGFVAMVGPLFDVNLGALSVTRAGFLPLIVGLASLVTVIRHTRTDEEAGRHELLGSTVVGRHAGLAAALIATFGANLLLGAIVTVGMYAQDLPLAGSVAVGLAYASAGWMFAAVGGVAAQLTEGAGAARALALGALGVAFVLRVGGDVGGAGMTWLSWLSPIGWTQQVRPYADERWWVFALAAGFVVVTAAAAVVVSARRDVGAGIVRPRPGPAAAGSRLSSALALAFRLQRGPLIGWVGGLALLGVFFGATAQGIGDLVAASPEFGEILTQLGGEAVLTDAYLAAMMSFYGLLVSGYAIQAALRMRAEETTERAEPLLATALSRARWVGSHLTFVVVGPALALVAGGLTMGLTHGVATGDVGQELPRVVAAAAVQLPAVWVLAGIAVAAFGLLPSLAAAVSWGALALFVFLSQFGPLLQLEQWVLDLAPYTHVPALPGGEFLAAPLLALAGLATLLTLAGMATFQRRDVGAA